MGVILARHGLFGQGSIPQAVYAHKGLSLQ